MNINALPTWSRLVLNTYYYATLPGRNQRNAQRAAAGKAPVAVLFYHRVANHSPNAWTISEARFARQIRWLKARFQLISLAEAQDRIRAGRNDETAVCVTFDDGYADNCRFALPLLISERIPVTYFVTSQNVIHNRPFPHDVTAGRPLQPNSLEQLRSLAAAGVEIGGHTRNHTDLGAISDRDMLFREIVGGRDELEEQLQCTVARFAFPFGLPANLNVEGFHLAAEEGFSAVCSAYGGYNFPGDDAFHIQRIHADSDMVRLKNWLTLDPRKLANVTRFAYQDPTRRAPSVGPVS